MDVHTIALNISALSSCMIEIKLDMIWQLTVLDKLYRLSSKGMKISLFLEQACYLFTINISHAKQFS